MIERLLIVAVLAVVGVVGYHVFARRHIRKAGSAAADDPILASLIPGIPAIVYFTTPLCIPCRTQQMPTLERLQAELGGGIQVIKIDATEQADAAKRWGVFCAPTTFVLDRLGQPREVNHGVADADKLRRQLQAVTA
jgi:thiol-disulfide isomerase/thioredoxin